VLLGARGLLLGHAVCWLGLLFLFGGNKMRNYACYLGLAVCDLGDSVRELGNLVCHLGIMFVIWAYWLFTWRIPFVNCASWFMACGTLFLSVASWLVTWGSPSVTCASCFVTWGVPFLSWVSWFGT
jgi:hypothetical protein